MSTDVDELSDTAQDISAFYYTAANHNILLESDIKTEIVDQLTIFPMPHAPAWCHGMISLRGKIIPVLDIAFALNTEPTEETRWLLILESAPLPQVAIKIDRLPARFNYKENDISTLKKGQQADWLTELVETEELTLFKANHSALFTALINENLALLTTQRLDTISQQDTSGDEA